VRTPSVTLGTPTVVARPTNLIARVGFDVAIQNWAAAIRK
jgi:hypothetical protein